MSLPDLRMEIEKERDALLRQQEILADISWNLSTLFQSLGVPTRTALMDALEGSRGMVGKAIEWAAEFDAFWEALPVGDSRREDYYSEIDEFTDTKFKTLIAETRLGG